MALRDQLPSFAITILSTVATASANGGHGETFVPLSANGAAVPLLLDESEKTTVTRYWTVAAKTAIYTQADFSDVADELEVSRIGIDVSYTTMASSGVWTYALGLEESEYETASGDFGETSELGLSATFLRPGERWSWFVNACANLGVDEESDLGDGAYFEAGTGVAYSFGPDLQLGLGLAGRSELEDDPSVVPFPIVEWKLSENGRIGTVKSSDPSLGYTYSFDEHLDGYVQLHMHQRQFRLDENLLADAAFVDEERGLRIGALYRPSVAVKVEAFAGVTERTLSVDVDGSEVADEDVEATPFFGLSLTLAL